MARNICHNCNHFLYFQYSDLLSRQKRFLETFETYKFYTLIIDWQYLLFCFYRSDYKWTPYLFCIENTRKKYLFIASAFTITDRFTSPDYLRHKL